MITPFFFVGSRRSGTTLLRRVLNQHPGIYCSFESGIMFVLQQIFSGKTVDQVKRETVNKWVHIHFTFSYAEDVFRRYEKSKLLTRFAFVNAIEECRIKRIGMDHEGERGFCPDVLGEKNPSEYSKPRMVDFILDTFPEARFIHLVRHPLAFAKSRVRHSYGLHGDENHPKIRESLVLWVKNEQRVFGVKSRTGGVFTVKYENLCFDPYHWVSELYHFLVPDTSSSVITKGSRIVGDNGNDKYDLSIPSGIDGLEELCARYGYR